MEWTWSEKHTAYLCGDEYFGAGVFQDWPEEVGKEPAGTAKGWTGNVVAYGTFEGIETFETLDLAKQACEKRLSELEEINIGEPK